MVNDTVSQLAAGVPSPPPVVLVGVQRHMHDAVLTVAAEMARDVHAELVCAHVNLDRPIRAADPRAPLPVVPGPPEWLAAGFDPVLAEHIDAVLDGSGVPWTGREGAGDPVRALARLARETNARMIVVGAHGATPPATLEEFLEGSVSTHLAHRQPVPVLIVPLSPVTDEELLPWE